MPFLKHQGNNNDDFVPTLSRSFHQGLVDKARQMNYDDENDGKATFFSLSFSLKKMHLMVCEEPFFMVVPKKSLVNIF